eukprot:280051-Chlamydomonas_euryale.AAC.8
MKAHHALGCCLARDAASVPLYLSSFTPFPSSCTGAPLRMRAGPSAPPARYPPTTQHTHRLTWLYSSTIATPSRLRFACCMQQACMSTMSALNDAQHARLAHGTFGTGLVLRWHMHGNMAHGQMAHAWMHGHMGAWADGTCMGTWAHGQRHMHGHMGARADGICMGARAHGQMAHAWAAGAWADGAWHMQTRGVRFATVLCVWKLPNQAHHAHHAHERLPRALTCVALSNARVVASQSAAKSCECTRVAAPQSAAEAWERVCMPLQRCAARSLAFTEVCPPRLALNVSTLSSRQKRLSARLAADECLDVTLQTCGSLRRRGRAAGRHTATVWLAAPRWHVAGTTRTW